MHWNVLKDYQFAAVELLSQMVRKETFKVVNFRKIFNTGAKLPKKHVYCELSNRLQHYL
jgi:hypothetical protein